jgi:DNA-binding transcriptional ArsR family regulator
MKKSSNNTPRDGAKQGSGSRSRPPHDHAAEIAEARDRMPAERVVEELAGLFDVLSNPMRLRIVLALRPARKEAPPELCVSDLAELLDASESLTSHQLRILRDAALVEQRKEGKLVLYHLTSRAVDHVLRQVIEGR